MSENHAANRGGTFLLFLLCGLAIWFFPFALEDMIRLFCQVALVLVFLLLSLWLKKSSKLSSYCPVFFAFFIAALATALATPFGGGTTIENRTFNVLVSATLVLLPILVLTKASGANYGSIYLKKGNLRLGTIIGTLTFAFFLVTALPAAQFFGAAPVTTEQLISWAPYIGVFIFANAIREELWFRGIFLRKYEVHFGKDTSNFLQALPFAAGHLVFPIMLYLQLNIILYIMTFLIGLACGAAMQKTDSILASIMLHAGADIPFLIAAFSVI